MNKLLGSHVLCILRGAGAVGLLSAFFLATWGTPGFAADADLKPLMDRLSRLERDIRTLYQGGVPAAGQAAGAASAPSSADPAIARFEVRLTNLESELRSATGRAEEVSHMLEQINQRLDKLIGDVDYRLSVLEKSQTQMRAQMQTGGTTAGPTQPSVATVSTPPGVDRIGTTPQGPQFATPPGSLGTLSQRDLQRFEQSQAGGPAPAAQVASAPAAPAPSPEPAAQAAAQVAVLPEGSAKDQYTYAFGLLRQTRYDDAEVALRAFLKLHGDHALSGNARYWLGETFYVRADYVKAAEVFLEGFQSSPKGPKAPDTLLKLGMSLARLEKTREACAAFDKLAADYTDAPTNILRLVERERSRNACE
ncbi:MAG: tol-pal system protein YbgF [Rhodospirillales bacterium]|nr:tol-pal system protein YbgF [Rhodospirillales bacterium]